MTVRKGNWLVRTIVNTLYFGHYSDVKIYFPFELFEFGVIWVITLGLMCQFL